jgi:hypothetical protein
MTRDQVLLRLVILPTVGFPILSRTLHLIRESWEIPRLAPDTLRAASHCLAFRRVVPGVLSLLRRVHGTARRVGEQVAKLLKLPQAPPLRIPDSPKIGPDADPLRCERIPHLRRGQRSVWAARDDGVPAGIAAGLEHPRLGEDDPQLGPSALGAGSPGDNDPPTPFAGRTKSPAAHFIVADLVSGATAIADYLDRARVHRL